MNKTLFPILALILTACTSSTTLSQTQVTVTLPPTATFTSITPEPTDTLIPIPTIAPTRYTSCADSELISEMEAEFESRSGMMLDVAYELARKDPDFPHEDVSPLGEPSYQFEVNYFYIGFRVLPGEDILSGKVKNVICAFGREMVPNQDGTYTTDPLVLGWEDMQGNYHPFVGSYDRASSAKEGDSSYDFKTDKNIYFASIKEVVNFLSRVPNGAIFNVNLRSFSRFSKIDEIVDEGGKAWERTKNLQEFLRTFGSEWVSRNLNQDVNGIEPTRDRINPAAGDQGLFPATFIYFDEGNLQSNQ